MESQEPLIAQEIETRRTGFAAELNKLSRIALPMMVVSLSQCMMRMILLMMLGHLGQLELSGAAIASSLCNVTGFSLIVGMASALETLCGQAYGAGSFQKVGTFTYGSIVWIFLVCIPISILWIYTEDLLILIGQDPDISREAGTFAMWLIPSLFPFAILQSLARYLQVQSLIMPMMWCAALSLFIQLPLSWLFIFTLNFRSAGAAISLCLSYSLNAIMLILVIKFSPSCKKSHAPFSKDVFLTFREYFRLAIPSSVMVCLEWWTFEIIILLGGLLTNPQLETSVLTVCLTITTLHYLVQYSFAAAASTRVSNELGAGKEEAAKGVLSAVLALCIGEILIAETVIFIFGSKFGYAFTNEKSFNSYFKQMIPLLCLSIIMDSLQSVLSGIARGAGWQRIAAYINLGAYYLVGIPVALLLGFVLDLKGKGLWGGLATGATVQALSLGIVAFRTDWKKQAIEARKRVFEGNSSTEDEEVI